MKGVPSKPAQRFSLFFSRTHEVVSQFIMFIAYFEASVAAPLDRQNYECQESIVKPFVPGVCFVQRQIHLFFLSWEILSVHVRIQERQFRI